MRDHIIPKGRVKVPKTPKTANLILRYEYVTCHRLCIGGPCHTNTNTIMIPITEYHHHTHHHR